jgi:hypothetical protein
VSELWTDLRLWRNIRGSRAIDPRRPSKPNGPKPRDIHVRNCTSTAEQRGRERSKLPSFAHAAGRSVIRVSSDGRPSRSAKPGHKPVPLFT